MSTEFLDKMLAGEFKPETTEELVQKRKDRRNEILVIDEADQEELTTEELVSEEVVDEVEESTDTAQPEDDIIEDVEESEEEISESEETDEVETNEDDDLYVDLKDGTQITLSEIAELKQDNMKAADYTKKTTELAEQRKVVDADKAKYNSLLSDLEEKSANLEAMMKEQSEDVDWDYLKEYNPAEYLEQKEKLEKREKTLAEVKGIKTSADNENQQKLVADESNKLFELNPEWIKDGKTSEVFDKDIKLMNDYLTNKVGMSNEEIGQIVSHKYWQVIKDAAKNNVNVNKKAALDKRLKKAPIVTKSHSKVSNQSVMNKEIASAQEKFNQSGSQKDLLALKKMKRAYAK